MKRTISFGPNYIIPKPLDPRFLSTVAPAVAKAAMESGVAQHPLLIGKLISTNLNKRLGLDNQVMRVIGNKARRDPKRIVFAEADNVKILKAAQIVFDEGIGYPILLGDETKIKDMAVANGIDMEGLPIFDPRSDEMEEKRNQVCRNIFLKKRAAKGSMPTKQKK